MKRKEEKSRIIILIILLVFANGICLNGIIFYALNRDNFEIVTATITDKHHEVRHSSWATVSYEIDGEKKIGEGIQVGLGEEVGDKIRIGIPKKGWMVTAIKDKWIVRLSFINDGSLWVLIIALWSGIIYYAVKSEKDPNYIEYNLRYIKLFLMRKGASVMLLGVTTIIALMWLVEELGRFSRITMIMMGIGTVVCIVYASVVDGKLYRLVRDGVVIDAEIDYSKSKYLYFDMLKIVATHRDTNDQNTTIFKQISIMGINNFIGRIFGKYKLKDTSKVKVLVDPVNFDRYIILSRNSFGDSYAPSAVTCIGVIFIVAIVLYIKVYL